MSAAAVERIPLAQLSLRGWFYAGAIALLAVLPLVAMPLGRGDLVSFLSLIMSFAMAAVSLNLILGYGGMISFGHAAYIAIGGYSVGICTYYGVTSAFIQWPLAIVLSALFAIVTGAICLRTRGVYFIMITLAFAQMVYFAFVSIEEYGGDDGLTINERSDVAGLIDLNNDVVLYYVILAFLLLALYAVHRIVRSRFGWVIRGTKSNEARMQALGYPTYSYRLVCYVIAGMICGMAGVLFANYANFVNPDDAAWTTSGELIFMVVLGGMGSLFGPMLGAATFFLMEEVLGSLPVVGIYWKIYFGPFLILVVLYARGGIDSWLVPHPEPAAPARLALAGIGRRLLAAAIDMAALLFAAWLLLGLAGPALMALPEADHHKHLIMVLCSYLLLAGVFINHFGLPRSRWRGSLGKIAAGIEVVSADGRRITAHQSVQRVFGLLLSMATLFVGYLWFAADPERRALHDRLAGTRVILRGGHHG